jgi:hypothetical protein
VHALEGVKSERVHVMEDGVPRGTVRIDAPAMPMRTRDLAARLAEVGWLFSRVAAAADVFGGDGAGAVSRSLAVALREEIAEFFRLVAAVDAQRKAATRKGAEGAANKVTLHRLLVWL